jgi:hypothetical protein
MHQQQAGINGKGHLRSVVHGIDRYGGEIGWDYQRFHVLEFYEGKMPT